MDGLPGADHSLLHAVGVSERQSMWSDISQMQAFRLHLAERGAAWAQEHEDFHAASVRHFRAFWREFLHWSQLEHGGSVAQVCTSDTAEAALFFPSVQLNYAASLLSRRWSDDLPAVTALGGATGPVRLSRGALRHRVSALATALHQLGIRPGDHVVGVMRNDAEAVTAALAATAIGATLATAAPEMGSEAILDRFAPLRPRLLFAHLAPAPHDQGEALAQRVAAIAGALEDCATLVALDDAPIPDGLRQPVLRAAALYDTAPEADAAGWPQLPFNHPLFVLFSSGTTGRPKCIVHGAGGTLIEHVKEHRLHCDLRPGDRLFFQTGCGWMMWNWQLSALASGAEIILYSGAVTETDRFWRIVAEQQATLFGTSPPYLRMSAAAGLEPGRDLDLTALRGVLTTGSVLEEAQHLWVHRHVKPVPVQSISGGTDIIGCFVLGHPHRPEIPGQIQSRSLALDVRMRSAEGDDVPGAVGELICANPFPSRPLGFFGDTGGERFHEAYFSQNPGVWTHGDLAEITPEGGIRMHGRSDGVMKIRGIRIGPAEIYRVVCRFPEVRDAMVVAQRQPDGDRAVLALVLEQGTRLTPALVTALRRALVHEASAAHVPEVVMQVDALPVTHTGKPSEAAMRDAVNGVPVRNIAALANPGCIDALANHPGLRGNHAIDLGDRAEADTESFLRALWEELLGVSPIGRDEDFFALGGHSLLAGRLFGEIEQRRGLRLPIATLFGAPTIAALAAVLDAPQRDGTQRLVAMRAAAGSTKPPLFLVHSMAGRMLELWALQRALTTPRAVFGIEARGFESGMAAQSCVHDMAADYIRVMRTQQPQGPYTIGGYSFGGLVALEMAQQLRAAGETVEQLIIMDAMVHPARLPAPQRLSHLLTRPGRDLRALLSAPPGQRLDWIAKKLIVATDRVRVKLGQPARRLDLVGNLVEEAHLPDDLRRVRGGMLTAARNYRPQPYAGMMTLIHPEQQGNQNMLRLWRKLARGGLTVRAVQGDHFTMILPAEVASLAAALDASLAA
ncbi:acetoacetate--CoA ligase [Teichococcus vastitatis]|uniref:Acetoacetate--CoA ligase n=1 Tax=Teichococcus vastitatis TaxID=2307076 RepID=A0ABS9W0D5_9PROT|nr:acetoacetate--CoA ligase [Pseudoroseomonas vastitatis]MCI0752657.1 acetoacetate--CoA ligase [Pseudoroseomonas vastitatis]